jgi:putative acetyltransferase
MARSVRDISRSVVGPGYGRRVSVIVRPAVVGDAAELHALSEEAILRSAASHYTEPQLRAWAGRRSVEGHVRMIERTAAFVAAEEGRAVGFATVALAPGRGLLAGEVDQLFVRPDSGGRGVAGLLLSAVERAARDAGLADLVTHASWRAVPVFERHGFVQVEVETVRIGDQQLTRALMRKPLVTAD